MSQQESGYPHADYAIRDLRAADLLVDGHLSAAKFEEVSGRSSYHAIKFFGSWNDAKEAAGLETSAPKNGMTNDRKQRRIEKIKEFLPCSRCSEHYPACVMDFHHQQSEEKRFHIRQGRHRRWKKIANELQKCDLLCANCHRIVEHMDYD